MSTSAPRPELKAALLKTIPVIAGYLVMGFGFGVLMAKLGYPFYWAGLISLFVYAGSMQYVLIGLLSGGAGLVTAALMTLVINARHLFYGLTMLGKYSQVKKCRPYLIFSLTDETFSLLCTGLPSKGLDPSRYYFYVSALGHAYWVTGSLLGGLMGEVLPFDFRGIEFSMTALFMVALMEQWRNSREHRPAVIGLAVSLLSLFVFGPEGFILPAMGLMLLCLLLYRNRLERGQTNEQA